MIVCDHRDASGRGLDTWYNEDHVEVCARCVHGVGKLRPVKNVAAMLKQMDFAALEARAMTAMMQEVGMTFRDDEVMGTEAQFEEFKRRWTEKYPDRTFVAMYGSKPD